RDWLFVEDHCRAIAAVLLNGQEGDTYVVGGLQGDVSNIDVVRMIIDMMGKDESSIEFVEDRKGHDRRYAVDWTKIRNEVGWEPSVTLEEGLEKTTQWYKENEAW